MPPWSGATRSYRRVLALLPAGILIGTVEEFELNETRTAYDVRIRLAADMTALHDVVLVKNQDYNEQRQLEEGI